jgi:hypothetical protein
MTMAVSKRMTTAKHFIEDAAAPGRLLPQSRLEFAIDAAYIAALEVAVRSGFELRPGDEDNHPLESVVRVALSVLPLSPQDTQLWPRFMHYLRNRYFVPFQADPAPLDQVLAWSARVVVSADQWLTGH